MLFIIFTIAAAVSKDMGMFIAFRFLMGSKFNESIRLML